MHDEMFNIKVVWTELGMLVTHTDIELGRVKVNKYIIRLLFVSFLNWEKIINCPLMSVPVYYGLFVIRKIVD